jgi:hypothetical protein
MGSSNLIPGSQVPKPPFDYHTPSFSTVAASVTNTALTPGGAVLDGVTLVAGERILLKDQTDATENGIYVFNGVGTAMTRATDFDDDEEFLYGAKVYVREGTVNADTTFKLTSDNVTVDTDAQVWVEEEDHLVEVAQVTNALAYTVASTFKDDDVLLVNDDWVGSTASVASSGTVASGSTRASLASLASRASVASVGTTASVASSASLASRPSIASSGTLASHASSASYASVSSTATGASYGSVGATSSFAGAVTVTLNTSQMPVSIKRIGSGAAYVAVEAPGSTELDGKDAALLEQYESIDVFTHNTNYFIR